MCCGQLCVWKDRIYLLCEGQTAISKNLDFRIYLTDIAFQLILAMFFSGKFIYLHIHWCGPKDIWSNDTEKFAHWLKCDFGAKQITSYCSCYTCQIMLQSCTYLNTYISSTSVLVRHVSEHAGTYLSPVTSLESLLETLVRSLTHNFTSTCQKSIRFFDPTSQLHFSMYYIVLGSF